ncbi:MAG TPA: Asp-tRNA(Asn)/Glu-tRNA(Gln) amidotransferase subunit GatB [Chitinophagaceae bacterium]|nr:Asp-tRNA(Asn)/Glu-tRNA(Gln) amidotransferase subunit GatB [Chitinophagaceae bacterium]
MIKDQSGYETIIGLEVHAQLLTKSKLFCGDRVAFGLEPNTAISPITLAYPGTLPKMNRKAIELAIRMGLACHCEIMQENYFVRKNYFYPDLPKGYQVSQHTTPICKGGSIKIKTASGEKAIQLNRIHLEEDAGKSLHDIDQDNTCIDYNRAGTPLIEIVTEPDIRSSEEAFLFLTELRKLVRYLDVCDGNMEEGSLRCDANISVRKKGERKLGTKVEVKNLNSVRNVKRAIEFEAHRLISCLERGETIIQQTRSFDADSGTTFSIREKEEADDYRYFPEPDLTPFHLNDEFISAIGKEIPALPLERIERYTRQLQLSEYDAEVLTEERNFADYFEKITKHTSQYKPAANWMLGPVRSWLNENKKEIGSFPLQPEQIASLIELVESGKVSFSMASTKIFLTLVKEPNKTPEQIAEEQNLLQQSDTSFLLPIVDEVLNKFANKVAEYKKGKKGLLSLFVGEVMKRSKGKADPAVTNQLILEKLKSQ